MKNKNTFRFLSQDINFYDNDTIILVSKTYLTPDGLKMYKVFRYEIKNKF